MNSSFIFVSRRLQRTVIFFLLFKVIVFQTSMVSAAEPGPIIYVATTGTDNNAGTAPETPLHSIAKALAITTHGTIKLASGLYSEPALALPANITISGGWDVQFVKQNKFTDTQLMKLKAEDDLCASYSCVTTESADRVITIKQPGVVLSDLVIVGPDRSKVTSSSSYGVLVDGADTTLTSVIIKGGRAGSGLDGNQGGPGADYCSSGGAGGIVNTWGDGFSLGCSDGSGKQGQSIPVNSATTVVGGAGGGTGENNCSVWSKSLNSDSEQGRQGGAGGSGVQGEAGTAVTADYGALSRLNDELHWLSNLTGTSGQNGGSGAGGGGGGAGGTWNIYYWCGVSYLIRGGSGQMGSRGGCGGGGGYGGHTGGSAISLVIGNATVSDTDLVIFGGEGGTGGVGGNGHVGVAGEINDTLGPQGSSTSGCAGWGPTRTGGRGGAGGHGGDGGGGGGGGGGNGGSSFVVIKLGTGNLKHAAGVKRLVAGKAGTGGGGGKAAVTAMEAAQGNYGNKFASEITLTVQ